MNKLTKTLFFLCLAISVFGQKVTISGYIKDKVNGEELIGAVVSIEELKVGVSTNVYGFYSLSIPPGDYTVTFSYIGFVTQKRKITLSKNITINVELEASVTELQEVVVRGEAADKNVTSTEMSTTKLDMREVKSLPVLFGEQDVIKTLQLTPGVKSAGEGSSGFYVRGGGTDQNLIILDEAPVYNASHVFGFLSVFNAEALKDVKLYKGNMPADYGGRLSSVLDIKMKEGNMKEYHGVGSIGTIDSKLTVEGPIAQDKASFMISARRTYFDALFLPLTKDTTLKKSKMYFYDLNMKVNYKIDDKNRIFLSGYFGQDVLNIAKIFGTNWGNTTATLRWNHLFNDKLFLNSTLIYSNYKYTIGVDMNGQTMDMDAGIRDYNWKEDFQYFLNANNNITFGVNSIYHRFNLGQMTSTMPGVNSVMLPYKYALESSAFISNNQKVSDRFSINYGFRLSSYNVIGPYTEYDYGINNTIPDSSVFAKGKIVKTYNDIEPRISANFSINEVSSIKAAYGKTNQYEHLLQNSTVGSPFDYWIPSTNIVKPEYANQGSVGYFRNFKENMFETSVEVYYKKMNNQVDYQSGTQIFLNEYVERDLLFGIGRSYGAEFEVRKKTGKLTGWIGYTLSKTQEQFDQINGGQWFNAKQDRTNDISVVGVYQLNQKISISGSWVYYTGDAITWPTGIYEVDGRWVESYSQRNANRMPNYHRLDLGLNYTKKSKHGFTNVFNFSIYNVYAKKNPYMIQFVDDKNNPRQKTAEAIYLFPIPIPAINYSMIF